MTKLVTLVHIENPDVNGRALFLDAETGKAYPAKDEHICQDCSSPGLMIDPVKKTIQIFLHDPTCPRIEPYERNGDPDDLIYGRRVVTDDEMTRFNEVKLKAGA